MVGEGEWNSVSFFILCGFSIDFLSAMFACGDSVVRMVGK